MKQPHFNPMPAEAKRVKRDVRHLTSDDVDNDVTAFLARGGRITEVPIGVGVDTPQHKVWSNKSNRAASVRARKRSQR